MIGSVAVLCMLLHAGRSWGCARRHDVPRDSCPSQHSERRYLWSGEWSFLRPKENERFLLSLLPAFSLPLPLFC